jgi:hypothetical protein
VARLQEEADLVAGIEDEAGEDVAVVHRARGGLFVLLEIAGSRVWPATGAGGRRGDRRWRW